VSVCFFPLLLANSCLSLALISASARVLLCFHPYQYIMLFNWHKKMVRIQLPRILLGGLFGCWSSKLSGRGPLPPDEFGISYCQNQFHDLSACAFALHSYSTVMHHTVSLIDRDQLFKTVCRRLRWNSHKELQAMLRNTGRQIHLCRDGGQSQHKHLPEKVCSTLLPDVLVHTVTQRSPCIRDS
jgi:hypothetical protein